MDGVQRIIGQLEAGFKGVADAQATHQASDDQAFGGIRRELQEIRKDISEMQGVATMVEGQGSAITDLETRTAKVEKDEAHRRGVHESNGKWIKASFALLLFLAGHATVWPKIAEVLSGK